MMNFLRSVAKLVSQWVQYRTLEETKSYQRGSVDNIAREVVDVACANDPIASKLINKRNLNRRGFFLIGIVAVVVTQGLSLLLYAINTALSASDLAQFLYQWQRVLTYWLVLPLLFTFYPWVTRSTGFLFADLYKDGVVKEDSNGPHKHFIEVCSSVKGHLSTRRWFYFVGLLIIFIHIYWITSGAVSGVWANVPYIGADVLLYFILSAPIQMFGFYMLLFGIVRVIVTIIGLFRLFGNAGSGEGSQRIIHIRPWHPDKCGGLGRLSRYAVHLSYFIALFGFWLVLYAHTYVSEYGFQGSIAVNSALWILILVYILLAPTLFFLTVGSARPAMLRAKSEHLHMISRLMDTAYADAIDEDRTSSKTELVNSADRVNILNELYRIKLRFPVWPFDFATIRRFGTAWIAPLIPLLVEWIDEIVPFLPTF